MKGPMKGATIAHAKQRRAKTRYIGVTEPGIIAAESPNPIVNHLVIMPDIEKRLEAFVRIGHGINLLSDPDTLLLLRNNRFLVEINLISTGCWNTIRTLTSIRFRSSYAPECPSA